MAEPHLQPVDQDGLLAGLVAQRFHLRAHCAFALGQVVAAGTAGAGGEHTVQPLDLRVLLGVDGACFLERHLVLLGALRQLGDLAVAIEQQALGLGEPRLDLRQAIA